MDAIIHTAAYHAPHLGVKNDIEFKKVNVEGTELLLDLAIRNNVNRFVFTSTTSVYGCTTRPKAEAVWVTETLPPNPEDIYDLTKLEAEQLCMQASKSGIDTVILRMSRCFPEPDHLQVFYRLYRGVSVRDVAEAHWLASSSTISGSEIFNISAISPFQRSEMKTIFRKPWEVIEKIYPGTCNIFNRMEWEKPASIDRVYVVNKAEALLNFKPKDNFWTYLQSKVNSSL